MVPFSPRLLLGLLALVLVLTACGRSSPNVTAEDGRGVERPSSGIWIPETRDVDPGSDMRRSDEEEGSSDEDENSSDEDEEERDGADRREVEDPQRTAAPDGRASDDGSSASTKAPSPGEPRPTGSSSPKRDAPASPAPRDPSGPGSGGTREDDADDEEDDEPAEPEVVGDCGSGASGPTPSEDELGSAVDELRVEIERRWPETQAGAWILEDPTEVHVGFTGAVASRLRELCGSFPYPQLLHGVRTELSDAELGELLRAVEDDRDELREGRTPRGLPKPIRDTKGRYVAAVEHASNGLAVTVEEPGEALLEAFRTHYTERLHLLEGEFDEHGDPVVDENE